MNTPNAMNIKRNIIFTIEKRRKDGVLIENNIPIRMRVIFDGKRIDFATGYRIDISKWNEDEHRVKNGCTNKLKQSSAEINAGLREQESAMQNIFKEFEVQGVMPTPDQIKSTFNSRLKLESAKEEVPKPEIGFWERYDEFTREVGHKNTWTKATYQKFAALKNHLTGFSDNLTFESFDESGLTDFVRFLSEELDMKNTTIGKQIDFLKWFLRWADLKSYHQTRDYAVFKPKLKKTDKKVIFLTVDELKQLRDFKIPESKQYLERIRDVFLFCCFSGLRHSDVYNLRRSDIKDGHIEVTTIKTADSIIIELNVITQGILKKYQDIHFEGDRVLPVISNQKSNEYIKELCELAGINEQIRITYYKGSERVDEVYSKYSLIGTHCGRRTFVCNGLAQGIPAQVMMKWTGHSDYKSMKPYIDIADKIRAESMTKFNNLLD